MIWIKSNIEKMPSFNPFLEQIRLIEQTIDENPRLCVETCKSIVEGICKTILNNKDVQFPKTSSFSGLVHMTIESVLNVEEPYRGDLVDLGRRIAGVSDKLGNIRNNSGFASHGMDALNPKLTNTLSLFASRIADTIGGFILSCYSNNRIVSVDHRIHYQDCFSFNEQFDEDFDALNPNAFGFIKISASLALFEQDYEAYKEAYFEYITKLSTSPD